MAQTVGNFYMTEANKDDVTPQKWQVLQTIGSGVTNGILEIVDTASSANNDRLISLVITPNDPTSAAVYSAHFGSVTAMNWPTASTAQYSVNFAPYGYELGSANTSSVSFVASGGTVTARFICQIARKV